MHFKEGRFVFAGGLYDQPAGYLRAMDIINNAMAEHDEEDRKQREENHGAR